MGRWPTIRRNKSLRPPSPSPSLQAKEGRGCGRGTDLDAGGGGGCAVTGQSAPTGIPPRLNTSASQDSVGRDETSLHDLCGEDDDGRWQELNPRHKAAIRAIRKMKYLVSRKKFREALKPYDVKDVIEQYSAGHVDLLGRVKSIQARLDQILGRQESKARDVYDSKICLAARIVKVERQVEDIDGKVEQLLDLYLEDRKRLLALLPPFSPNSSPPSGGNNAPSSPPPPARASGTRRHKPRPILVGKQFSEPNSPVIRFSESTNQKHEDYGKNPVSKMRKRVTLSSIPLQETVTIDENTVTRTLDRLEIPDTESPHPHLLNFNTDDDFDQDNDQYVFHKEEMTTVVPSLTMGSRNGIFEGTCVDIVEDENTL